VAERSGISWTDGTFNPWIGCTRVSPGCDHCYAARDNERHKWVQGWGTGIPRRRTKTWGDPLKWNRKAAETGYRPRIFCASLADVFDNEVPDQWRADLWQLFSETPNIRWMVLTKRVGNVTKMAPASWWPHVGIMATMVNQEEYDRDRLKLSGVKAPWRGISAEPLLGRIILDHKDAKTNVDWVITGGESGPGFRALDMGAVRYLRDQCRDLGITFHHKQNGGIRGKDAGCLVDGVEHKHFPPMLAA
jgi:protein gp37